MSNIPPPLDDRGTSLHGGFGTAEIVMAMICLLLIAGGLAYMVVSCVIVP